jgi:hypothetical protein
VFNVLVASSHVDETSNVSLVTTRKPEGIELLPTELFDAICTYLSTQSVVKLHRSSKALAMNVLLDNTFWRDRLRRGTLHPHIWDLDTKQIETLRKESNIAFSATGWDWRTVAKLLAVQRFGRDSSLDDMPLGFWNRCRIWTIIEEALNEEALTNESSTSSSRERIDSVAENRKKHHASGASVAGDELENA